MNGQDLIINLAIVTGGVLLAAGLIRLGVRKNIPLLRDLA